MRALTITLALASALIGTSNAANATLVTQFLSTTITGNLTVDTLGLFGPKGANLAGKRMNVRFQYQTDDLNSPPANCTAPTGPYVSRSPKMQNPLSVTQYACTYYSSAGAPDGLGNVTLTQSFLIVVDVDGVIAAFAPALSGEMQISNQQLPSTLQIGLNLGGYLGYPSCSLLVYYQKGIYVAGPIYPPYNVPSSSAVGKIGFSLAIPTQGQKYSEEQFTFTVQGAAP